MYSIIENLSIKGKIDNITEKELSKILELFRYLDVKWGYMQNKNGTYNINTDNDGICKLHKYINQENK